MVDGDHKKVSTQQLRVGVKYLAAGLLGVRYEHVNCLPLRGSRFMRSRLPGGPPPHPRENTHPQPGIKALQQKAIVDING